MKNRNAVKSISLLVSVVAKAVGYGLISILLSAISLSYGLNEMQEGLIGSLISAGSLVSLSATISFSIPVSKDKMIVLGGMLMSLAFLLQSANIAFPLFLAMGFISGIGFGLLDTYQSSYMADLHQGKTQQMMGVLHGVYGAVGIIAPPVIGRLLHASGWRNVYFTAAGICLALTAQLLLVGRKWCGTASHIRMDGADETNQSIYAQEDGQKKFSFGRVKILLQNHRFLLTLCITFFSAASQSLVVTWTLRYVSAGITTAAIAALILSLFWLTVTAARFLVPMLFRNQWYFLAGGFAVTGVCWTLAVASGNVVIFIAACCAAGLSLGPYLPAVLSEGASMDRTNTGPPTSMVMLVRAVAHILSPLMVSAIAIRFGLKIALYILPLFLTLAAIAQLGLVAYKTNSKHTR